MEVPSMVDSAAFIGYLQAALTHAEVHSVHINGTRKGLIFSWYCDVCVFIFVDRYLDLDFLASTFSNGLY